MSHRTFWVVMFCCFLLSMVNGNGLAQGTYPERPIQALVSYAPGGSTDSGARVIAEYMQKYLKQPFLIVNKPGGGSSIAGNELFRAKPDGYTLGMFTSAPTTPEYTMNPQNFIYKTKDLQPVAEWSKNLTVFLSRYDAPWKSIEELIKHAKANPSKLVWSHAGRGNRDWIEGTLFVGQAGIKMLDVPFQGAADSMTALLGGNVDVVVTSYGGVTIGQMEAKKIRALAISDEKRSSVLPDVPTLKELGYEIGTPENYLGMFAPKGTPAEVLQKLNEAVLKATQDPEVQQKLAKIGLAASYKNAKDLEQLVDNFGKFQFKILKELGVLK